MGAFDHIYMLGSRAKPGTPYGYGILAIKQELILNGFTDLDPVALVIGKRASKAIHAFQNASGLAVDGEVGPHTAVALYRKRFTALQEAVKVPDQILCKLTQLESACDPGAVGVSDPTDLGIVQIHIPAHPTITIEDAFTPSWALPWAATMLRNAEQRFHDWDVAIASWNIGGGGAAYWQEQGKPASLFVSWFVDHDGNELDLGERATHYVELVRSRTC